MLAVKKRDAFVSITSTKRESKGSESLGDYRVIMCAKRIKEEEYLGGLCRTKEEKERQRQLLDAVCKHPPAVLQSPADVSEDVCPEQQEHKTSSIKKEEEPQPTHIIEEKQEVDITKFPLTCVIVKGEEVDNERSGGSQADGVLAPLSDSDNITSDLSDTDDDNNDEHSEGDLAYHANDKGVKCCQCDKTFSSKSSLNRHTRTHTGEQPFACSICGKRFSRKTHLTRHTRTHTGEKPFACSVCGRRFTIKEKMNSHTRIHTGEKPFACSFCGQSFCLMASLTTHMRKHTGEKPYLCSVCGERFTEKTYLTRHTRTHTGDKPFVCLVCGKRFARNAHLTTHTRTHTGDKHSAAVHVLKDFFTSIR